MGDGGRDYTWEMKKVEVSATRTSERLALAGKKVLVRFTRSVEEGSVEGYVLAVGPDSSFLPSWTKTLDSMAFSASACKMSGIFRCLPNMQRSRKRP